MQTATNATCDFVGWVSIAETYGWGWVTSEPHPWVLPHIFMPFSIFYVTRSWGFAVLLILLNEVIEWTLFLSNGHYVGFPDSFSAEAIGDSIIGDPVAGFIGIALAAYATWVFNTPRLLTSSLRYGVWWRNVVAVVAIAWLTTRLQINYYSEYVTCGTQFPTGIVYYAGGSCAIIAALWVWDRFHAAVRVPIWGDRPFGDIHRTYGVWIGTNLAFSAAFACPFTYPYLVGAVAVVLVVALYSCVVLARVMLARHPATGAQMRLVPPLPSVLGRGGGGAKEMKFF